MEPPRPHALSALLLLTFIFAGDALAIGNDPFASPIDWGSQSSVSTEFDARLATRQQGEPSHAGNSSTGTSWWKWTAPENGRWRIEQDESFGGGHRLVAYTGDSLDSLVEVGTAYSAPLEVDVVAGQEYRLVLAHDGWVGLAATFTGPPDNDAFSSPESLGSAHQVSVVDSTAVASLEAGEPEHETGSEGGGSIWWEWTAPEDGILRYDLEGTSVPSWVVNAYAGEEIDGLTRIASLVIYDDYAKSKVIRVSAGSLIRFAAARRNSGDEGELTLNLDFDAEPNNDHPEDAVDLGNITSGSFSGDLSGATDEEGWTARSVWWKWTPPTNGVLRLTTDDIDPWNVDLAVFRHLPDETLEEIAQGYIDPYCQAGETLLIKVSDSSATEFSINLEFLAAAENDRFENAAPLVIGGNSLDSFNAGPDPGQPGEPSAASLWWQWTAPADGALIVDGLPRYYGIGLYQGNDPASLIAINDFENDGRWLVASGETYTMMVAVSPPFADQTETILSADFVEATPGNDDFVDRHDLGTPWSSHFFGDLSTASAEPSDPSGASATRWWSWTAPQQAAVFLQGQGWWSTSDNRYYNSIRIYQGNTLETMGAAVFPITSPAYLDHFIASSGESYHLSLVGSPGAEPSIIDYQLRAYPLPHSNDHFADATDLGSTQSHRERLTMVGATLEAGEPDHDPEDNHYISTSRWWTWSAGEDQNVEVSLEEANGWPYSFFVGVYQGDSLESLELVKTEISGSSGLTLRFPAQEGESYRIVAGGGTGEMDFELRARTPPAGDRFDDPIVLTEGAYVRHSNPFPGEYPGASIEADEPMPFYPYHVSLWRKWIAPADGLFEFSEGLRYGTWMVTEGDQLETLTTEGISDGWSRWVSSGEEIMILHQTDERHPGSAGCKFHAIPANDDYAGATDLGSAEAVTDSAELYASSLEAGEPEWAADDGLPFEPGSVWWQWTAPRNGVLRIFTDFDSSSSGDSVVVARGSEMASIDVLLVDDHWYHQTFLPVSAGETLHIGAVVRNARLEGEVQLELQFIDAPDNDVWFRAADLGSGELGRGSGTNDGAILESFEGEDAGEATIWWSWTAPRDGTGLFVAEAIEGDEAISVYESDGAGGISPRPTTGVSVDAGAAVATEVSSGETLWFSVGVTGTSLRDEIGILIQMVDGVANDRFEHASPTPALSNFAFESSFVGALGSAGEPDPFGLAGLAPSLWWSWTAPSTDFHRLESPGDGVAVFQGGGLATLTEVAASSTGALVWAATAGQTYHFQVTSIDHSWSTMSLSLQAVAPAENDNFDDRVVIPPSLAIVDGHNLGTTAEPGEPAHAGQAAGESVWYEWTPTTEGGLIIEAPDSFRLSVYQGSALGDLMESASGTGQVILPVESGVSYQIAVDSGTDGPGAFSLSLSARTLPSNDDFENRILLDGLPHELQADFSFATTEDDEYPLAHQSLWWEWTAPDSDDLEFRQISGIPALVFAYEHRTGYPLEVRQLGFPNSVHGGLFVRAGRRYFFQIATGSPGQIGTARFLIGSPSAPPTGGATTRPPNDDFADRIELDSRERVRSSLIDLAGATNETGEPVYRSDRGVWWTWTAPSSGYFKLTSLARYARSLEVFTGGTVDGLTTVARGSTSVPFEAQAGTAYQITQRIRDSYLDRDIREDRLAGFDLGPAPSDPANDDFVNREDLGEDVGISHPGHNILASSEPAEPAHAGSGPDASVWYAWTAPSTGTFEVNAFGAVMTTAIYKGAALDSLVEVASGSDPIEFEAQGGSTYAIALDRDSPAEFSIRMDQITSDPEPADPPPNDHFADAIPLTGSAIATTGTLTMASLEEGEPLPGGTSAGASVWWSWTAPQSGIAAIECDSSHPSPATAIYRGPSLAELSLLGYASGAVVLEVEAGATYPIAAIGTSSDFDLNISFLPATVANDHFADAELVTGTHLTVAGTTEGASMQEGEPSHGISSSSTSPRTVWFSWECPVSADYDIFHDLDGTTGLSIYTGGDLGSLDLIARDSDSLRFSATAGVIYRIAVSNVRIPGPFTLSIEGVERPVNDDFTDRIDLGGAFGARGTGTTDEATREEGERLHDYAYSAGGTLWWSWTAPSSGPAHLDAGASEHDNILAVYTGTELGDLAVIAEERGRFLGFEAVAGITYQVVIGSTSSDSTGSVDFLIGMTTPANDDFADAIALPSLLPTGASSPTTGSTLEVGEIRWTSGTPLGSLWWEWTPATSGPVDLVLGHSSAPLYPAVFTGHMLPVLELVPGSAPAKRVFRFEAVAGVTYRIGMAHDRVGQAPAIEFQILPARALPVNDLFSDALPLSGSSDVSESHNWGASTQPGEPADHTRSLWWRWSAPTSGAVLTSTNGTANLYSGSTLSGLQLVPAASDAGQSFMVEGGMEYHLAVNTSDFPTDITVELEMAPPGDYFANPVQLPSGDWQALSIDLSDFTWENFEPWHAGGAPERSAWFRWTAPETGQYRFLADHPVDFRIVVYAGDRLASLTPVAEGMGELAFGAVSGTTYHIVVDSALDGGSNTVDLLMVGEPTGYAGWRDAYFTGAEHPDSSPLADPDNDWRSNLFERALGSHPLIADHGPLPVSMERSDEFIVLSVTRPVGVSGIHYTFDVGSDLDAWTGTESLNTEQWVDDHGDGTETLSVRLLDHRSAAESVFFHRLRIEEIPPQ